jgi:hypothetical protein
VRCAHCRGAARRKAKERIDRGARGRIVARSTALRWPLSRGVVGPSSETP